MKQEKIDFRIDLLIFKQIIIISLASKKLAGPMCSHTFFFTYFKTSHFLSIAGETYMIAVRIVRRYNLSGEILLLAKALSHSQHMITLKHA